MMIREKWELVMSSAQVKVEGSGMRPFLFGTRPSELEEQILRSARDRGWETTRNSFFFFSYNVLCFPSPTLLFNSYPIWLSHHFLFPSLSKTHEKSHLSPLSLLLHLRPLHSTLDTSPEHSVRFISAVSNSDFAKSSGNSVFFYLDSQQY